MSHQPASSSVNLLGLTALAFVVLKLCHVIDWSWCWVLSPLWIPVAAIIAFAVIVIAGICAIAGWKSLLEWRKA